MRLRVSLRTPQNGYYGRGPNQGVVLIGDPRWAHRPLTRNDPRTRFARPAMRKRRGVKIFCLAVRRLCLLAYKEKLVSDALGHDIRR